MTLAFERRSHLVAPLRRPHSLVSIPFRFPVTWICCRGWRRPTEVAQAMPRPALQQAALELVAAPATGPAPHSARTAAAAAADAVRRAVRHAVGAVRVPLERVGRVCNSTWQPECERGRALPLLHVCIDHCPSRTCRISSCPYSSRITSVNEGPYRQTVECGAHAGRRFR